MRYDKFHAAVLCAAFLLTGCGNVGTAAVRPETDELSGTSAPDAAYNESVTAAVQPTEEEAPEQAELSPEEELLAEMTLEQKICQLFMVKPEMLTCTSPVTEAGDGILSALREYPVGGILLFEQNLVSQEQTSAMIAAVQDCAREACGAGLFVAVDEEGGTVARAANKLGTASFSNMAYYGSLNDTDTAYGIGSAIGKDLHGLGFNVDFAPVADVNINSANELGSRIFSSDPNVVADMVTAVTAGLQDEGVCATLKHFPGLGAESGNTHTDSAVIIDRTVPELRETEFVPFRAAINGGADFVMVGHQTVTGIGDGLPADLSYTVVTGLLRGELGFEGIAVTDSHQMNTISGTYSAGGAALIALQAGMDIILLPSDLPGAVERLCTAVRNGEISEERIDESVLRILRQKSELGLL